MTIEVEADVVEVELSLELDGEAVDGVMVDKLLFVVRIVRFAKTKRRNNEQRELLTH